MPPLRGWPRPQRTEDRGSVNLPFEIAWKTSDGQRHLAAAHARDIAASSVYFEVEPSSCLSSPDLLLQLETGRELSLYAVARVVRVEAKGGKIGVAVVVEDIGPYCRRREGPFWLGRSLRLRQALSDIFSGGECEPGQG